MKTDSGTLFLFLQAVELPEAERGAFLDQVGHRDVALRQRLEEMLGDDAAAVEFFGEGGTVVTPGGAARVAAEKPGDLIGRYRLLEMIGEGGFGVVWMAEQTEPVARRVALKIIRLGMDTREFIARFEQERQALALMDHPNIARVHDGGATPGGRPYFVMELVQGVPVTTFCDEQKLPLPARLELFVQVCHAIQHAHQKGIIHRDIKPSNILVACGDEGQPVPRVIDFGIAKAVDRTLTDKTFATDFGQLIGTPAYMSPEQVGTGPMDIDTRSDVYSLGVLLYEMLTGRPPFDPKELLKAGIDEMRRVIREDEPPRPSTRVSTMADAQRTGFAQSRHTEVPKLVSTLRGDLDWIVMKALEKDRTRRYETATGLAADISRYLRREPVFARPPSFSYRAGKFVKKYKGPVIAAAVVVVTLLVGITASTVMYLREKAALTRESGERRKAQMESRMNALTAVFLKEMISAASPEEARGEDTKLMKRILGKAALRVEPGFKDQPAVEMYLRDTIGNTYRELGFPAEALEHFEKALKIGIQTLGQEDWRTMAVQNNLAGVYWNLGRFAEAEQLDRQLIELQTRLLGAEHPETLKTITNLASVLHDLGRYEEAENLLRPALEVARRVLDPNDQTMAVLVGKLAFNCKNMEKYDEAEKLYFEEREIEVKARGADHPGALHAASSLAMVYIRQDRAPEAEALARATLEVQQQVSGPKHPDTLTTISVISGSCAAQGKYDEAEQLSAEALAARREVNGPEDHRTLLEAANLAEVYLRRGKLEEADVLLREVREIRTRVFGAQHPNTVAVLSSLALCCQRRNNTVEAEQLLREALVRLESQGQGLELTMKAVTSLAETCYNLRNFARSESLYLKLLETTKRLHGTDSKLLPKLYHHLGNTYYEQRKTDEAVRFFQEGLDLSKKAGNNRLSAEFLNNLGTIRQDQGRLTEAIDLMEQAVELSRKANGAESRQTLNFLTHLVRVQRDAGRTAKAVERLKELVDMEKRVIGESDPDTLKTMDALAIGYSKLDKHKEAEAAFREVLEASRQHIGKEDQRTLMRMGNLVAELLQQEKYPEAEALHRDLLSLKKRVLGARHKDTIESMRRLADICDKLNKGAEAEALRREINDNRSEEEAPSAK